MNGTALSRTCEQVARDRTQYGGNDTHDPHVSGPLPIRRTVGTWSIDHLHPRSAAGPETESKCTDYNDGQDGKQGDIASALSRRYRHRDNHGKATKCNRQRGGPPDESPRARHSSAERQCCRRGSQIRRTRDTTPASRVSGSVSRTAAFPLGQPDLDSARPVRIA
jgi:hypothetical protein